MAVVSGSSTQSRLSRARILLLGPPASGKGTMAGRLGAVAGEPISSGQLIRSEIRRKTPAGLKIAPCLRQGGLIPESHILALMRKWYWRRRLARGFILDGFPRTILQARVFDQWMEARGEFLHACILLELAEDAAVRRISGRLTCTSCGRSFHRQANPPTRERVCDSCNGPLTVREDDTEATVRGRYRTYREQTAPVAEYYRGQGLLFPLDASSSIDGLFGEIVSIMEEIS